jgi:uncharacterized protein
MIFFLLLGFSLFFTPSVLGEINSDISFLYALSGKKEPSEKSSVFFFPKFEDSELRMFAYLVIGSYQNFISSQQYNVCMFEPSCSHYGQEAVNSFGFVRGTIVTADRLIRCNPYAATYGYPMNPLSGKLIDPIDVFPLESRTAP